LDDFSSAPFSPIGQIVNGMEFVDRINPEYGQDPSQQSISSQGDGYLDAQYPNLSFISNATKRR